MTTATAEQAAALTPTPRQLLRRGGFWVVIALVVIAVGGVALIRSASSLRADFDPASAAPEGSMALAEVLREQGVRVSVVTSAAAAEASDGALFVDDGATAVPASVWRRLAASHDRLVVASPDATALDALLPAARLAGHPQGSRAAAACSTELARRAGSMSLTGLDRSLRIQGGRACFADSSGAGQLVTARSGSTRVILLADRKAFSNERIGVAGNAAVALGALGATADLTWYVPDPLDFATGPATLQDLTPPWVTPVAALLMIAGLAAALWRGRRLGPVVVERLPVVVRSRETVEGRARLYSSGRARLRAADSLRIGAVGRMAAMLGLSRTATVQDVAGAASRVTGRPASEVQAVLLTAEPAGDRDLLRISDDLTRLEAAVRAATVPGTDPVRGTDDR